MRRSAPTRPVNARSSRMTGGQGYDVQLSFVFTKPKSTPKKYKLNTKRPDLDKLIRAVLDGITDVLIPDDALVVSITASKCYGDGNQPPGLRIKVTRLK